MWPPPSLGLPPTSQACDLSVVTDAAGDYSLAYCLTAIADGGCHPSQWTSFTLKSHSYYFEAAPQGIAEGVRRYCADSAAVAAAAGAAEASSGSGTGSSAVARRSSTATSGIGAAAASSDAPATVPPAAVGGVKGGRGGKGAKAASAAAASEKAHAEDASAPSCVVDATPILMPSYAFAKGTAPLFKPTSCSGGSDNSAWSRVSNASPKLAASLVVRRYELRKEDTPDSDGYDRYCWSEVVDPLRLTSALLARQPIPLRQLPPLASAGSPDFVVPAGLLGAGSVAALASPSASPASSPVLKAQPGAAAGGAAAKRGRGSSSASAAHRAPSPPPPSLAVSSAPPPPPSLVLDSGVTSSSTSGTTTIDVTPPLSLAVTGPLVPVCVAPSEATSDTSSGSIEGCVVPIHSHLDWSELQWSPGGVSIRGCFYRLRSFRCLKNWPRYRVGYGLPPFTAASDASSMSAALRSWRDHLAFPGPRQPASYLGAAEAKPHAAPAASGSVSAASSSGGRATRGAAASFSSSSSSHLSNEGVDLRPLFAKSALWQAPPQPMSLSIDRLIENPEADANCSGSSSGNSGGGTAPGASNASMEVDH